MSQPATGPGAPDVTGPADPDAITARSEAPREELGRAVDEFAHRLDVRGDDYQLEVRNIRPEDAYTR